MNSPTDFVITPTTTKTVSSHPFWSRNPWNKYWQIQQLNQTLRQPCTTVSWWSCFEGTNKFQQNNRKKKKKVKQTLRNWAILFMETRESIFAKKNSKCGKQTLLWNNYYTYFRKKTIILQRKQSRVKFDKSDPGRIKLNRENIFEKLQNCFEKVTNQMSLWKRSMTSQIWASFLPAKTSR